MPKRDSPDVSQRRNRRFPPSAEDVIFAAILVGSGFLFAWFIEALLR